ncbi:LuxR C-terminal-related transcriptional regulator [Pseudonocardia lacus]|uniref:LuxR C-terminal-related transcriptional regulator n=1 Tax=Pseudonocardia lacus TaxID=2835865 RepID=UPI001BDD4CEE|nr:LuxR family transcriptional regulator [Pseudonocardia lacus]
MLVGRGGECGRLDDVLAAAAAGNPRVVALRGDPGIGKTCLLEYVAERAGGFRVVRAAGHEAEREIPFAALSMVVGPLLATVPQLADAQVSALEGALNLGPAVHGDRLAVGPATLAALAAAADHGPVLLAVDDVHLFDMPSLETLFFALRRLHAERVAVVMTARSEADVLPVVEQWLEPIEQIRVEGLDLASARELTAERGTLSVAAWEAATGNPLALLEMTAANSADVLDEPLQLSARLLRAYGRRLVGLPARTRDALLLLAVAGRAGDMLDAALAQRGLDRTDLEPAEDTGLVLQESGTTAFTHPLVCSAVYHSVSPATKRSAHRTLVEVYSGRSAPGAAERRAFHLAAATAGPDESVAAQLAESARTAAARHSHTTAAVLFEKAARLSPPGSDRAGRILEAAFAGQAAGTLDVVAPLLEAAIAETEDEDLLTAAQHLQCRIQMWSGQPARARDQLLDLAERTGARAPEWAAMMLSQAAVVSIVLGDQRAAGDMAARAAHLVRHLPDEQALQVLVVRAVTIAMNDDPAPARALLERCAPHLRTSDPLSIDQLPVLASSAYASIEQGAQARALLEGAVRATRNAQAVGLLPFQLSWLAWQCWRDGEWVSALAHAQAAVALAEETGWATELPNGLIVQATVEAALGDADAARAHAEQAARLGTGQSDSGIFAAHAARVLGLLELGAGNPEQAAEHLEVAGGFALAHRIGERVLFSWAGDLTEALARCGRVEQARTAALAAAREAERTGAPNAMAVDARCRALLASSDEEGALAFEEALRWHTSAGRPFEQARTQLCYGEFLRRQQRRVDARPHLAAALATFTRLGAAPWARRAEAELQATGMTSRKAAPSATERLTPQELQVATVVADGATNSEAATRLFLSAKTIEYHLSNIYRKLGIRSRVELARRMMAGHEPEPAPAQRSPAAPRPSTAPRQRSTTSARATPPPARRPAAAPDAALSPGPAAARPPAMA